MLHHQLLLPLPRHLALRLDYLVAEQLHELMRQRRDDWHENEIVPARSHRDRAGDGRHVDGELAAAQRV
jgi:hypothetical protein